MQKLVWQNSIGDSVDLTSGNYGITEWEGFSNAPLNIQSQQVPFQDGAVFLDALMEQRELSVTLKMQDNGNLENRYRMRRELIHILNPKFGEGYLIYTNDFTGKRIKCVPQIPLFKTHNSNDSGTPEASLAWTACEPYWEDLEETRIVVKNSSYTIVENGGDISCNIKARLLSYGNIKNPTLRNNSTNQKIRINGTFNNGINIDTNAGEKKVVKEILDTDLGVLPIISIIVYSEEKNLLVCVHINEIFIGIPQEKNIQFHIKQKINTTLINNIIYCKEKGFFIGVTENHQIIKSQDGENWSVQAYETNAIFSDICYSEDLDLFVIVGGVSGISSLILTSSDGENWNDASPSNTNLLKKIVYASNIHKFAIIGDNTTFLTSEDGITWESATVPYAQTFIGLFYIKETGTIIITNGSLSTYNNNIIYSTDVENFTLVNCPYVLHIGYYNGAYYLSGGKLQRNKTGFVKKSFNLQDFEDVLLAYHEYFTQSIFIKGYNYLFVNGSVSYIGNDDIFSFLYKSQSETTLSHTFYSPKGLYIVVDMSGYYVRENNKTTFNYYKKLESLGNHAYRDICYSEKLDLYAMCCSGGQVLTSHNCIDWEYHETGTNKDFTKIIYSEEKEMFVILGDSDMALMISSNGMDWINVSVPASITEYFIDVIYDDNLHTFLLINTHYVYKTSDFMNFDLLQYFSDVRSLSYISCNKEYIAIIGRIGNAGHYKGVLYYSRDGEIWFTKKESEEIEYNHIIYSENMAEFLIACTNGNVISSGDLVSWSVLFSTITPMKYIAYSPKDICVFGIIERKTGTYQTYFSSEENIINKISLDSDMNFNFSIGKNMISLISENNANFNAIITFRQKYIGV